MTITKEMKAFAKALIAHKASKKLYISVNRGGVQSNLKVYGRRIILN